MSRKERRAAEHIQRKADRKAGFPTTPAPTPQTPISPDRLAANQANAKLSHGPITPEGRATSSQNSATHGLTRHNGIFKLLPTEDEIGFVSLKRSLAGEHQPTTETETIFINTMAESHWLSNRAQHLINTCLDPDTGVVTDPKMFSLYLRYQTTHTRAFHKSLNDLIKLRAERRRAENGFVAQKRQDAELAMKEVAQNFKIQCESELHAWKSPIVRADITRLGQASMTGGPEYDRLKAEFHAQYGPPQKGAAA